MSRKSCLPLFLAVISILIFSQAPAQQARTNERIVPEIKAVHANPHAPQIDGFLDDPVWKEAGKSGVREFTQTDPDEGKAATESTLVAVVYDDEALYVAFWCYDSEPDKIARQLVRRDRVAERDYVTVRLDPYHDHKSGNAFEISAAGVMRDCRYSDEYNADMSWDAVWNCEAKIHDWGWSAEYKIPFSCLRFREQDVATWGIDFIRGINRKAEFVKWAFTPEADGGFVSNFGHLTGLEGIQSSRHMEILPYAVSRAEVEPKSPGNPDGRNYLGNTGVDVKYSIFSSLVLNAAINPDFGQVELDNPVLNLSVYETQFEEKRPFFVEGLDIFSTNFMLLYPRRIGRQLYSGVNDDEAIYYTDYPDVTTILGAAKITGKLSKRTSIGILTAVTEEEKAKYAAQTNVVLDAEDNIVSADTTMREGVIEPLANYGVFRIKQDILKNSHVGGLFTMVNKDGVHPAVTGGVDWRLGTNNNYWILYGQAVFSRNDPSNTGYGVTAQIEKAGGKHVRGSIGGTIKSPELDISNMGYTPRVDTKRFSSWLQYRTTDDWWIFRNTYHNLNFYSEWNFAGYNHSLGGNYNTYIEFRNRWDFGGGVEIQAEKYSDLERWGNGLWEWPKVPTWSWWFSLNTDGRKKVSFNWNPGGGTDRGGTWWANYVGVYYKPKSNMEFSTGVNWFNEENTLRYIGEGSQGSVFAELDRNMISLDGRFGLIINRNLSMQLSGSGYIAGLDYENYRYYLGGQDYSEPVDGINVDNNRVALNSSFLIRWEYLPGSTLYLVWTRSRYERDRTLRDMDFSRDFDRLFKGDSYNVFLIKASYWFNV